MKDLPRIILKDMVRRYGESLVHDPFRCEALLRDTCGSCGREIFVLVSAVRQHVPIDLLAPRHNFPLSLMKGFMIKRLQDEMGLSDESARWAVETWAEALGLSENTDKEDLTSGATPVNRVSGETSGTHPPPDPARRQQWATKLDDGVIDTRLRTVEELAKAGDRESIRLLISALENDRWRVRSAAYDALVSLSGTAVPLLLEALADSHDGLVSRVILILAAIQDHDATEPLTALLGRERSLDLRIIFALGEIGDDRATSPLSKYLVSPDPDISLAVAGALKKISGT
ncbi:HEAT repeat domain-containing protein [uncultured Methanoregula sp.]|uniref:HEAT repeat domain-containing protein n=1 Tax=uncultured Methanoregula sp. TaxID=1005933 RepID=UPI002AAAD072|nr:HEAT repeat domain-containing protein [uncultured Methanoregula sp.]